MNREIKFRAWYKNAMEYNVSKMNDGLYWDKSGDFNIFAFLDPENKMMEYIGTKDENGKEIYEGDIVDCNRYTTDDIFRVLVTDIRNIPEQMRGSNLNSLKVVGNVFENPDIVEEYGLTPQR